MTPLFARASILGVAGASLLFLLCKEMSLKPRSSARINMIFGFV